jgi:hypothetical protein
MESMQDTSHAPEAISGNDFYGYESSQANSNRNIPFWLEDFHHRTSLTSQTAVPNPSMQFLLSTNDDNESVFRSAFSIDQC